MRRPALIATDLDGTFLGPGESIPDINLLAVRRATQAGVPIVIATGRPTRSLGPVAELDGTHAIVVASNGAAVYDRDSATMLAVHPLDPTDILYAIYQLRFAAPGIVFGVETGSDYGCEPGGPQEEFDDWGAWSGTAEQIVARCRPALKLLGFHHGLGSDELVAISTDVVGERLAVTHASTTHRFGMVEFGPLGASKATGLAEVCARLGVAAADVAAFGDMPNDLDMLRWAGMPFVVANAHPSLIDAGFPVVAANAEAGVGHTILELLDSEG